MTREVGPIRVVVFSGGRGSGVLSAELLRDPRIALTLAINGYDDGASTGEVRRFLGDSLGPSDFRKNASRLASILRTCPPALVEILDRRLPVGVTRDAAVAALRVVGRGSPTAGAGDSGMAELRDRLDPTARAALASRLEAFECELRRTGTPFDFSDCSVGNLVFAGSFLTRGRDFNAAVADYCELLRLPAGMIENVTDGANAHLVAIDADNRLLGTEAEIVNGASRRIREIFLLDRPIEAAERDRLNAGPVAATLALLARHATPVRPNPALLARLAEADLIISAPGTQHSSLFPSYLTPGIGPTIAGNLKALKLLITNIQQDAEIGDASAVELVDRAVYYLREKGKHGSIPTPCLITHFLINDPARVDPERPHVPLGRVEALEDPRLIRIGNYEDGVSGRHDATAVLTPFITSLLQRGRRPRIAVLLLETARVHLIIQSLLEMVRGGIGDLDATVIALYGSAESLGESFTRALPFATRNVGDTGPAAFARALAELELDYVVLFESSGMYRGEDVVNVASLLAGGTLDSVWGSRRLSVSDIRESYRVRYRHNLLFGGVSYVGSHLLSLAYLVMYGRYVSDTLSGVRAVRARFLEAPGIDLGSKRLNHELLSEMLSRRAGVFETPVQFLPISPKRARRTTVLEGLQSLATIVRWKLRRRAA